MRYERRHLKDDQVASWIIAGHRQKGKCLSPFSRLRSLLPRQAGKSLVVHPKWKPVILRRPQLRKDYCFICLSTPSVWLGYPLLFLLSLTSVLWEEYFWVWFSQQAHSLLACTPISSRDKSQQPLTDEWRTQTLQPAQHQITELESVSNKANLELTERSRSQTIVTFTSKAACTSPSPGDYLAGIGRLSWSWTSSRMEYPKPRRQSFLQATAMLRNKGRSWHLSENPTAATASFTLPNCLPALSQVAHPDSQLLLCLSSPTPPQSYQPNADWVQTNPQEHSSACDVPCYWCCACPKSNNLLAGHHTVPNCCFSAQANLYKQNATEELSSQAFCLAQMFKPTHINGKEPHVKFPSTPSFSPRIYLTFSQNHLDSVGTRVFEVFPRRCCVLGVFCVLTMAQQCTLVVVKISHAPGRLGPSKTSTWKEKVAGFSSLRMLRTWLDKVSHLNPTSGLALLQGD